MSIRLTLLFMATLSIGYSAHGGCIFAGTPEENHEFFSKSCELQGGELQPYTMSYDPSYEAIGGIGIYKAKCKFTYAGGGESSFDIGANILYSSDPDSPKTCLEPEEEIELNIANLRVGQRVFEPTTGASTDLISGKPFAVEAVVTGKVPLKYKNLTAIARLYMNGISDPIGNSGPFKIGDVLRDSAKVLVFSQTSLIGSKLLTLKIEPITPELGVFDQSHAVSQSRTVSFKFLKLSLLISEIKGCANTGSCFLPPDLSNKNGVVNEQIANAEELLPISPGQLSYSIGASITDSVPARSTYLLGMQNDALNLWLKKNGEQKDLGIALVDQSYYRVHGYSRPDAVGFVFNTYRDIAFITNETSSLVLAHELFHSVGSMDHSEAQNLEVAGSSFGESWTPGWSLDNFSEFKKNSYINLMTRNSLVAADKVAVPRDFYNNAFANILRRQRGNSSSANTRSLAVSSTSSEPQEMILVGGLIGRDGNIISLKTAEASTFPSELSGAPNVTIQALNASDNVVSSVQAVASSELEFITSNGVISENAEASIFMATLPKVVGAEKIQIISKGKVIATRELSPINFASIMSGLKADSFLGNRVQASIYLHVVNCLYKGYQDFLRKKNIRSAKRALEIIKIALAATLKEKVVINNKLYTKKMILDTLANEIRNLK